MAVRPVLLYPHPSLKRAARALDPERDAKQIEQVARDLLDTMEGGPRTVGIAAPQLDELVRMVVVDVSEHPKATSSHGRLVLVNPRIVLATGSEIAREGCLSIPHLTANVRRATEIVVEAMQVDGKPVAIRAAGFEARALAHEIDHLDGILFLDRVESVKDDVFRRKSYG
jgi:peptide deformylase